MQKAKGTRKSTGRAEFILRPSIWRMVIVYITMFALAVVFGLLIRAIFSGGFSAQNLFGDWYINLAIVVGGAVVFAFFDVRRWTMKVKGGMQLEGPSGAFGERVVLPVRDINWERSGKSLRSRVKVGTAIYTYSGRRILISPWFYDPAVFKEFLDHIGYR